MQEQQKAIREAKEKSMSRKEDKKTAAVEKAKLRVRLLEAVRVAVLDNGRGLPHLSVKQLEAVYTHHHQTLPKFKNKKDLLEQIEADIVSVGSIEQLLPMGVILAFVVF